MCKILCKHFFFLCKICAHFLHISNLHSVQTPREDTVTVSSRGLRCKPKCKMCTKMCKFLCKFFFFLCKICAHFLHISNLHSVYTPREDTVGNTTSAVLHTYIPNIRWGRNTYLLAFEYTIHKRCNGKKQRPHYYVDICKQA